MHIPNGFIDPKLGVGFGLITAGVLGYCMAKVRALITAPVFRTALATAGQKAHTIGGYARSVLTDFGEQFLLKMALVASIIFAAQMFNFPISHGTSGHLLGGVLAAVVVGPFAGVIVMAIVVAVQALFFADGGLGALGANILNMGIIGAFACYYIYYGIRKLIKHWSGIYIGAFIAAFCSVVLAALATSLQLALSGTIPLNLVIPAMMHVHAIIGVAEGLITVLLLGLMTMSHSNILYEEKNNDK